MIKSFFKSLDRVVNYFILYNFLLFAKLIIYNLFTWSSKNVFVVIHSPSIVSFHLPEKFSPVCFRHVPIKTGCSCSWGTMIHIKTLLSLNRGFPSLSWVGISFSTSFPTSFSVGLLCSGRVLSPVASCETLH